MHKATHPYNLLFAAEYLRVYRWSPFTLRIDTQKLYRERGRDLTKLKSDINF